MLYITKGYHPLSFVESPWLRRLVLHQCKRVQFPIQKQLMNEVLPNIMKKPKEKYVFPTFISCITCITSFDFWMLCVGYDMFAMVVNFINNFWDPTHVIVEMQNTTSKAMAKPCKNYTRHIWFTCKSHR
jgi:hypothetical protein